MGKLIDDKRIHEGHRSRMRAKLMTHGAGIFDTYEILEMLLYYVIPYRDTNPISKQLLCRFGSLEGVLTADREELVKVPGIGERAAELLTTVGSVDSILGVDIGSDNPRLFTTYAQVGSYFADFFEAQRRARVAIMLFDNKMRRIDTVGIENFDFQSAKTLPHTFIDSVIKARASVIITAHCTPNEPMLPTEGDRASNSMINAAMNAIGSIHLEHYLVSGHNYIGMINNRTGRFAAYAEINRFLQSKTEAIAMGIAKDPADYMPDYYSTVSN